MMLHMQYAINIYIITWRCVFAWYDMFWDSVRISVLSIIISQPSLMSCIILHCR